MSQEKKEFRPANVRVNALAKGVSPKQADELVEELTKEAIERGYTIK